MVIAPSQTYTHTCSRACMVGEFKLVFLQRLGGESPLVGASGRASGYPVPWLPSWERGAEASACSPLLSCPNPKGHLKHGSDILPCQPCPGPEMIVLQLNAAKAPKDRSAEKQCGSCLTCGFRADLELILSEGSPWAMAHLRLDPGRSPFFPS